MKILNVDDNPDNRYLVESMLHNGFRVTSVNNGVEALEKLREEPFDLILADILMPQMDGFELCRQVKLSEALRRIPVVFYTATYTEKKDQELGLALGASRFIVKPVEPQKFLEIIQEVVTEAQSGELKSAQPAAGEQALLESYNLQLVRKLDQKVEQLEAVSRELRKAIEARDLEILERRRAEAEVRTLNTQLESRVQSRTAELAVVNRQLEAFASAVSHDLRSPMRKIESLIQFLLQDYADNLQGEARNYLDIISGEAHRMGGLVDALFKLSQATRGELRKEKVDLSLLASEIQNNLRRQQPERAVEFVVASGVFVRGDPVLIRAVLQNLLDNAWKFTSKTAHARIEFGVSGGSEEGPIYFIRDNGAGFDNKLAARLFAPFQRLHSTEDFPGTGIGLATVRQIILRHGGRIWAEGAPDQGATFFFTLP